MKRYKVSYLKDPVAKILKDGKRVELTDDFVFVVNGIRAVVPSGFISDLASIPWLFTRILPRFGPWNHAAIAHDWMYQVGRINEWILTQGDADRIMYALMLYNTEVPRRKAFCIYLGLRLGGFCAWSMYRNAARQAS